MDQELKSRLDHLLATLPHPLGLLLARPLSANSPDRRHELLVHAWECVFRTSAIAFWVFARMLDLRSQPFSSQCKGLKRPSFGIWTGLLREGRILLERHSSRPELTPLRPLLTGLASPLRGHPGLEALGARFQAIPNAPARVQGNVVCALVDAFAAYRNRTLGHDVVDSQFRHESNDPLLQGLIEYLEMCPPLGDAAAVVVQSIEIHDGRPRAWLASMCGSYRTLEPCEISDGTARSLETGHPYLFTRPELLLRLSPLVAASRRGEEWTLGWLARQVHGTRLAYDAATTEFQANVRDDDMEELFAADQDTEIACEDASMEPWRGLLAYDEDHARLFIGREEETSQALARLEREGCLVICGPSGSGKSSLMKAGVIPALRETTKETGRFLVCVKTKPGANPVAALREAFQKAELCPGIDRTEWWGLVDLQFQSSADRSQAEGVGSLCAFLAHQGCHVLVCVDQLEEIVTACSDRAERIRFLDILAEFVRRSEAEPVWVIATIRADLIQDLFVDPLFRSLFERHALLLGRMDEPRMRRVVLEPLRSRRVECEPGLPETIINEVGDEPGNLALLSHVLQLLWTDRARFGNRLTQQAYAQSGGISGALRIQAEEALKEVEECVLGGVDRSDLESVLQQLVFLRENGSLGRRRSVLSHTAEATGLDAAKVRALLAPFEKRRLLVYGGADEQGGGTVGSQTVEVAHEALLAGWPLFRELMQKEAEVILLRQAVERAARAWEQAGKKGELWTDATSRLRRAEELTEDGRLHLLRTEIDFLRACRRGVHLRKALLRTGIVVLLAAAGCVAAFEWRADLAQRRAEHAERENTFERQKEALSAFEKGDPLEARALLRASFESEDSLDMRALWMRLSRSPLRWAERMDSEVSGLAFSPSGNELAVAAATPKLRILDTWTLSSRILECGEGNIYSVAYSPDGDHLASGTGTGRVQYWDGHAGTCTDLGRHDRLVSSVAFDATGKRLLTGSFDKSVRLWDVTRGALVRTFNAHTDVVTSVAWSPDGSSIASSSKDGTVRTWDVTTGAEVSVLRSTDDKEITEVAFDASGSLLASAGMDGRASVRNPLTGETVSEAPSLGSRLYALAWGGERVAAASERDIFLWRPDLDEVRILGGHLAEVQDVVFDQNGSHLASGSMDWTVKLWDLDMDLPSLAVRGHEQVVSSARFSADGQHIVSAGWDGTIRVWNTASGREERVLGGHGGRVQDALFDPEGTMIASAGTDTTIRLWSTDTWRTTANLEGHQNTVASLAFSPDGQTLVSSAWREKARRWNVGEASFQGLVENGGPGVSVFSADGRTLIRGDSFGYLMEFDATSGRKGRESKVSDGEIRGLDRMPGGSSFAWVTDQGEIGIWDFDTRTGHQVGRANGEGRSLAARPDGTLIAVATNHPEVLLVDVFTGKIRPLVGHREAVSTVAWSHDGSLLVTAGFDGTIRTWEPDSGRPWWRGTALLHQPVAIDTQAGWESLEAPGETMRQTSWGSAVNDRGVRAEQSTDGRSLCVRTTRDELELWTMADDQKLAAWEGVDVVDLVALPGACVIRDSKGRVQRWTVTDGGRDLLMGASSLDPDPKGFLAVSAGTLVEFAADGSELSRLLVDGSLASVGRVAGEWVLGGLEGGIRILRHDDEGKESGLYLQDLPASIPTRLVEGPGSSLVAGFRDGTVGLWNPKNGRQLLGMRLHGPIRDIVSDGGHIYVLTELGDHEELDLGVLTTPYCDLLREIWRRVPIGWEGRPLAKSVPKEHICQRQGSPE